MLESILEQFPYGPLHSRLQAKLFCAWEVGPPATINMHIAKDQVIAPSLFVASSSMVGC